MNTATTKRFRGRAGRRIAAALVAAAALGLGATACGPEDSKSAGSPASSASQDASQDTSQDTSASGGSTDQSTGGSAKGGSSTGGSSSDGSGSQSQKGGGTDDGSASTGGGGVANAGNHRTFVGKLKYLAPGKLLVHPDDGSTDQAFFVANATQIRGAAAICADDPGRVSLGADGYGTAKCTVDDVEKAAKTGSVTVRVTLSTKSAGAERIEEKYHP
ncbi:hypothetical protein [Streptomyces cuspidosporus]|uniref:Lipoprotein n=1 Tax=Streptomyces cuspidosporus TaxID=66882 RepID=A0ABP5TIK2_9ACTN